MQRYEIEVDVRHGRGAEIVVKEVGDDQHWIEVGRATVDMSPDDTVGEMLSRAFGDQLRNIT
jgi:hypothetical protein